MPQLDFSYYISQITWLLISFGGFFCISRFLILPQLERILSTRSDLIETNTRFAQDAIDKANKIKQECDSAILENDKAMEEMMAKFLNEVKQNNNKKIDDLKKHLAEKENKSILKVKSDILKLESDINNQIAIVVAEILKKVYFVEPDEKKIAKLVSKVEI